VETASANCYELIECSGSLRTGAEAIRQQVGVNIDVCLHCRCCGAGCPFSAAMDYYPHQIMRLIQFGLVDEALNSTAIWTCVGCYTCSAQCPMAIDVPAVMDALRHMALRNAATVAEPKILAFHREVQRSIAKYGRTHKAEIMLRYKFKTRQFFSDVTTGLRMFAARKLEFSPSRVRNRAILKRIMNAGEVS
jgi:heterodisulfide reductase subunit C